MRALAVPLFLAPVAVALLVGWLAPRAADAPASATPRGPERIGPPDGAADPSAALEDLAGYIVEDAPADPVQVSQAEPVLTGEPVVAPAPPLEPPPPPPPPPDVGLVFRKQVTGVLGEPGGRLAVMLVDATSGGARRMRVGDRFEGRWTLISLTRDAAVLSDGARLRRIPFFGGPVTSEGVSGE